MRKKSGLAKISRPGLRKIFKRDRLLKKFDTALDSPVIWIVGPPGCGKTTLAANYIKESKHPCFWYQVDERDEDPASFFHYMSLAAKKASPRTKKTLPSFSLEYMQGLPVFTLHFFEHLYNKLKSSSILVFDNYQTVEKSSVFHDIMARGVSIIPKNLNIVIISRSSPPKALTRLLANNMMEIIDFKDLRLSQDETNGIVKVRSKKQYSKTAIKMMCNKIDGWVSGLILLLESEKSETISFEHIDHETPEKIFNYFAGEIFDRADKQTQHFLLRTSYLPKMNMEMAQKITRIEQTHKILTRLNRNNYFITRFGHPKLFYQYHPMFRSFLLTKAEQSLSINEQQTLEKKSARLLEEEQEFESAALLYISSKDYESLVRLIMTQSQIFIEQGRNSVVLEWIQSIPEEMVTMMPWLIFWKGVCLLSLEPAKSKICFINAFQLFSNQKDTAGKLLSWAGVIDAIIINFESFRSFDPWIKNFDSIKDDYNSFPIPEIKTRVAGGMFKAMLLRHPQNPKIEKWALAGLLPGDSPDQINYNALILCHLHGYYANYKIDAKKARIYLKKLQIIESQPLINPISIILSWYSQINYYELKGRTKSCEKIYEKFRKLEETTGVTLFHVLISGHLLAVYLDTSENIKARSLLSKMQDVSESMKPWEKWLYTLQKARFYLIENQLQKAREWIEKGIELSDNIGTPLGKLACLPIQIYTLHKLGEHILANRVLDDYFKHSSRLDSPKDLFMALMAKAYLLLKSGKKPEGMKALKQGLASGREYGFLNVFSDLPSATTFLCVKALEEEIETQYVRSIIKKRRLMTVPPPVHIDNWPWPFKIFTLGGFGLELDGQPFPFTGKIQQKPLAMLKILVAKGDKKVHENLIADALWPYADGFKARKAFATTLHRLRKLLKVKKAIVLEDRYLKLDQHFFWVDAWTFKKLIEQSNRLSWNQSKIDDFQKMILAQKAIGLYEGDFLKSEEWDPDILNTRINLKDLFIKGVLTVGYYFEKNQQWKKAIEAYESVVNENIIAEDIHKKIILCYQAQGKHLQAKMAYDRYKKVIGKEDQGASFPEYHSINKIFDPS